MAGGPHLQGDRAAQGAHVSTPRDARPTTRGPAGQGRSARGFGVCRVFAGRRLTACGPRPRGRACVGQWSHRRAEARPVRRRDGG